MGFKVKTEVGNYLYLDGRGFPRWRDEEYASVFRTTKEAQRIIDGCGLHHMDDRLEIVRA